MSIPTLTERIRAIVRARAIERNPFPLAELLDEPADERSDWDRYAGQLCRSCRAARLPCRHVPMATAARWRPGDPIYRGGT